MQTYDIARMLDNYLLKYILYECVYFQVLFSTTDFKSATSHTKFLHPVEHALNAKPGQESRKL